MDLFETLGLGPRQSEENELYVAIYADPSDGPGAPADADPTSAYSIHTSAGAETPSVSSLSEADHLELLRSCCTAWLLPYMSDYVWNKDPLVLRSSTRQPPPWQGRRKRGLGVAKEHRRRRKAPSGDLEERLGDNGNPNSSNDGDGSGDTTGDRGGEAEGCLWAVMRFGDAVDDEWWAVWLLMRMTRELQDLSVQVWDNDGQFLLIEAAYALPRWLKPEIADNRVWLRRGCLHVVPLPNAAVPDLLPSPTVGQALRVLRQERIPTASQRVQRPIDERLAGYPIRARRQQQHVARCLLPGPLAAALRTEPQLVSDLVEAFYLRDADDMRVASRMRFLPPSLERFPELVRMTRCHYAQMAQQRFAAPRGLTMPPVDSPLAKAADLGLKLTVGAEIICARHAASVLERRQGQQERRQEGSLSEAQFAADPMWRRFKASLEANGYFQGNIAGSRRHKELLAVALEAFVTDRVTEGVAGDDGAAATAPAGVTPRNPRRRLAELVLGGAASGSVITEADVAAG